MLSILNTIAKRVGIVIAASLIVSASFAQDIPSGFKIAPEWQVGAELGGGYVFGTNDFLKGATYDGVPIRGTEVLSLRGAFRFNPESWEGMLFKGLTQGLGVDIRSFNAPQRLGTPVSLYAFQGMPFAHFGRLSLGYEWQFGAAFGWKHYDEETAPENGAVSTPVTAHMGLGLRLNYALTERWTLTGAIYATHYSNGNTSLPNSGVNALNAAVGVAYVLDQKGEPTPAPAGLVSEADRPGWFYDIMIFGAWRKRAIDVGYDPQLCPGKFGVLGLQFAPMRKFNRYFAAGVAVDLKYDESSGLLPYWVESTYGEDIKFYRPPFGKQLSAGLSAHAELTMPIFAVNAGFGYDILSPKGEKRFYQSLTVKAFVLPKVFINVGYRLGGFKDPQNLMLGLGFRL